MISITGNRGIFGGATGEAGGMGFNFDKKWDMSSFKAGEKISRQVLFSEHKEEKRREDKKVEIFPL